MAVPWWNRAIMLLLAQGSPLLPDDPYLRAEVTSWLFFEQADLAHALAYPRFFHLRGVADQMTAKIKFLKEIGYPAMEKLDRWLMSLDWLVDGRYTLADLGVFPYVSMASERGYDMSRFPATEAWLARISAQLGWIPLIEEA